MSRSQETPESSSPVPVTRFTARFEPQGESFGVTDDAPLLRAAEFAGLALPSSCRNGSCRTCMCMLVSGKVRYLIQWPGLLAEEKEMGWILPCIAYPESDVVLSRQRPR